MLQSFILIYALFFLAGCTQKNDLSLYDVPEKPNVPTKEELSKKIHDTKQSQRAVLNAGKQNIAND